MAYFRFLHFIFSLHKILLQRTSSILKRSPKGTKAQASIQSPKHSSTISPASSSTGYQPSIFGGKKGKENKKNLPDT